MNILNLPDAVAAVMLTAAHELDETAVDHGLVHGSTFTGRAMKIAATSLVVGAMPLIVLDFATGGHRRRRELDLSPSTEFTGRNDSEWINRHRL